MRDFEAPGRSVVVARDGMAATSHPLSTLTALDVLRAGGNAMDAAVAACAVQSVVEPHMTGIGGDCFALYAPGGREEIVAYNGSGRAPAAATASRLAELGVTKLERPSPHVVTVPGAVEAWARLVADHGTRPLGELLGPAIRLAREGSALSPRTARDWDREAAFLRGQPIAAATFLADGAVPRVGALHRQPALADTLQAIAEGGPRAFYEGPIAADMVETLRAAGGLHTQEDFAARRGAYEPVIHTDFRGHRVYECSGNGQGVIALLILNVLSRFKPTEDPLDPDRLHLEAEATRQAYAIRDRYLADHPDMPTEWLLSDALADQIAAGIDLKASIAPIRPILSPEHRDTVYLCVVDKNRNAVSFINSLFALFGSGLMSAKTGVLFHNRGQSFVTDPAHLNCIAPGKRPLHTIIPGMLAQGGRVTMPFGVMGGHYQAMGHAHFLSKVIDYGLDLQTAMDLPRLFPRPDTGQLEAETRIRDRSGSELARRGFDVIAPAGPIGGAQAISIDWEAGTLLGASDPRKDGCAMGY